MGAVVVDGVFVTHRDHHEEDEFKAVLLWKLLVRHFGAAYMDMWDWVYDRPCFERDRVGLPLAIGTRTHTRAHEHTHKHAGENTPGA